MKVYVIIETDNEGVYPLTRTSQTRRYVTAVTLMLVSIDYALRRIFGEDW